jgi:predicted small lipoprotein YifL
MTRLLASPSRSGMVRPNLEPSVTFRLTASRLATLAALIVALGLGACGRKGPLDAPPGAVADPTSAPTASNTSLQPQPQTQEERSLFGDPNRSSPATAPVAPKGQKRRIPLDVLLD